MNPASWLPTPLELDGWLEFNRAKWGVRPLRLRLAEKGKDLPAVEAVLYLDRRGRIVMPPLNPYLPVIFHLTPTEKQTRLYRQWVGVSTLLAKEFKRRGVRGGTSFYPNVVDVRAWQWQGFIAEVRYTLHIGLPHSVDDYDQQVRNKISKGLRAGFECRRVLARERGDVYGVLQGTEARQRFSYRLTSGDLEHAEKVLGDEAFRLYVCQGPDGRTAAARVVLHRPGGRAMDWVAGTHRDYLQTGATQLLFHYVLNDLYEAGAVSLDFCGANIPGVSAAKSTWGGLLVPFYIVRAPGLQSLVWIGRNAWTFRRRR